MASLERVKMRSPEQKWWLDDEQWRMAFAQHTATMRLIFRLAVVAVVLLSVWMVIGVWSK